jgi:hypothetical protein
MKKCQRLETRDPEKVAQINFLRGPQPSPASAVESDITGRPVGAARDKLPEMARKPERGRRIDPAGTEDLWAA